MEGERREESESHLIAGEEGGQVILRRPDAAGRRVCLSVGDIAMVQTDYVCKQIIMSVNREIMSVNREA